DTGTELVNQSGDTLIDIVDSIRNVASLIESIDHSSKEQFESIVQINVALTKMDDMTQQNAALVEESTAASLAMSSQANSLSDALGFFGGSDCSVNTKNMDERKQVQPLVSLSNTATDTNEGEWTEF
ncbi:MAG: hypothetical protein MI867_30525, partial [Pseudomonadales bacterium]|nr:hypothetical protein [Pseudomonadales bacterium]